MILPDHQIEYIARDGCIDPYDPEMLQPSSYDLKLGNSFLTPFRAKDMKALGINWIDPFAQRTIDAAFLRFTVQDGEPLPLAPGQFLLGSTKERVKVPTNLVCRLEGKSSLGRLGLAVHITAGYIDPGFEGNITLEMVNFLPIPIMLTPGMPIAQIGFIEMSDTPSKPYQGRYQGDRGAVQSKYGIKKEDQ